MRQNLTLLVGEYKTAISSGVKIRNPCQKIYRIINKCDPECPDLLDDIEYAWKET